MHHEYDISIITINFNGFEDTCALIDSITFNNQYKLEVIVVDNASRQDEATALADKYPAITVLRSQTNLGFAGGNNLGIQAAHGKYIFLVNNDTEFREGWSFKPLIDQLESAPDMGIVCPKIRFAWGTMPIQYVGFTPLSRISIRNSTIGYMEEDHGQYKTPRPTPYAHGAAMLLKRDAIETVGLMPECYFLYYEELDWSMMFTRAGYRICCVPSVTIYHKESQTTGKSSPLKSFYMTRNRLQLVRRNITGATKYLSYLYLTALVLPRDLLKHVCQNRADLAKATWQGVMSFLKRETGYKQLVTT